MVPVLQRAGHEVVGLDTFYFSNHHNKLPSKGLLELDQDIRDFA